MDIEQKNRTHTHTLQNSLHGHEGVFIVQPYQMELKLFNVVHSVH